MCTAITYLTNDFYFGRNLDYETLYGENITVTPRNFCFKMRYSEPLTSHYAIIGMAHVQDNYPLYYDAVNEKGLCIAGLNFVGNAVYAENPKEGKHNITQYEFIPWLLGRCADVKEARGLIENMNLLGTPFCKGMPTAALHWCIADRNECITIEAVKDGIKIYDNPVGVLTNNPPFPMQMFALNNYMQLSPKPPVNRFAEQFDFDIYSRGMGAIGLPGDLSSQSRFIRAAFVRMNSVSGDGEEQSVSQFFHMLGSVEQQRGCCLLDNGECEITLYSCCVNADKGIYYYTTYENSQITAVDMNRENLDASELICYPLEDKPNICRLN